MDSFDNCGDHHMHVHNDACAGYQRCVFLTWKESEDDKSNYIACIKCSAYILFIYINQKVY